MRLSRKQCVEMGIPVPAASRAARKWNGQDPERKDKSAKADMFDAMCRAHDLPTPVHEFQFCPDRKWRFDFLFQGWLALEVEGGIWTQGRHTRGRGFLADIDKYNFASLLGYVVVRCVPNDITTGEAFALVKRALGTLEEQP